MTRVGGIHRPPRALHNVLRGLTALLPHCPPDTMCPKGMGVVGPGGGVMTRWSHLEG